MAETTSDLQTDVETTKEKRKRRPTSRYMLSETDSDDTIGTPSKNRKVPIPPPAPVPPPEPVPLLPSTTLPSPHPMQPTAPQRRDLFPDSQGTFHTQRSKRVEEKVLQLLEETKEQNRSTQRLLTQILRKLSCETTNSSDDLPEGVKFPLDSKEQLLAVEGKLADKQFKDKVFGYLSTIGGTNIPDAVRRVRRAVLGHTLATQYNWVGKGGKKSAFGPLALKDVMTSAIRKSIPSATNAEIEPVMKDWLRYAKDRQGGRQGRRSRE